MKFQTLSLQNEFSGITNEFHENEEKQKRIVSVG